MQETQTPDDASQAKPAIPQAQAPINFADPQRQQPYIVYVPQNGQQQPQYSYGYNQVNPVQYPNIQRPGPQQPLLQQQYYYQPQQIVPPPIVPQIIYNHDELSKAGKNEKRFFNMLILANFMLIQSAALIFSCISTFNPMIEMFYNPYNQYLKPQFYVIGTALCITWIVGFTNSRKLRNKPFSIIHFILFLVFFSLFLQGIYSTTYYYSDSGYLTQNGAGQYIILIWSYFSLINLGLFAYAFQELEGLDLKRSMGYVVFPSVGLSGVYALYGLLDPISLVIVPLFCIVIGQYIIYLLKRANEKGMMKIRTDEFMHASVLLHFIMILPFYEEKEEN